MSKMKKVLLMCTAYALVAVLSIGGTLAYFTDRDSEVNTFTVGDVAIELNEKFEQGAELVPGVKIEKIPTITNTGDNDAWVWMTFSIPSALDNWTPGTDAGSNENVIHWNPLGATCKGNVTEARVNNAINLGYLPASATVADIVDNGKTWDVFNAMINGGNCYKETIGNVEYNTYVLPYNKALEPGETTLPGLYRVFLDSRVDISPEGDWYFVENGETTKLTWNSNTDGNPLIYVSAYAIQADEFDDVYKAYAAYNKQWGDKGTEYPAVVSTLKDLKDAAKNGGTYVLADDIVITDKNEFFYSKYVTAVYNDMTLDLNGHNIVIDVDMGNTANAAVLFYVYAEDASLTIVGDGDVIAKHDAFIVFPRGVCEGVYIYGGNYYNNDETSGKANDINAIVYSQTNRNIHIYGGTYTFKNVSGHCGGFNVYDNSGAEIILHEGVLLSNSNYFKGSDADEIHLAEGCTLQEVNIDGTTWYKVVAE